MSIKAIWNWMQVALAFLSDLRVAVRPARFQLLAVVLCAGALLFSGQGTDVVLMMVEDQRYVMAPLIAALFGIVAWYSARVACQLRMKDERGILEAYRRDYGPAVHRGPSKAELARARTQWIIKSRAAAPRLLGVAPAAILALAVAFRIDGATVPDGGRLKFLIVLGGLIVLLLVFFVYRRPLAERFHAWLRARGLRRLAASFALRECPADVHQRFQEMLPVTRFIVRGALVVFGAAAVLAAYDPVQFGATAGAYISFFVVLSALCIFGGWLAVATRQSNAPVFTGLILLAALGTILSGGGQYAMRSVPGTGTAVAERPSVADAASAWLADNAAGPEEGIVPVYIVATAGGGSRAAYWTAEVLDWLAQEVPGFDRRLFAISGVSGGSVGAVAHVAGAGRSAATPDTAETQAHAMLRHDFLAAPVLGLFLRDLPARLIPVASLRPADRGIMLEQGWEHADNAVDGDGRWSRPFLSLWPDDARPWPALFLNGTEVQTGRRIVTTNLGIRKDPGFVDVSDLLATIGRDIPASTAANTSARFPIVGPAALVAGPEPDAQEIQVVDGGYFENFGATTAREVLQVFWATAERRAERAGGLALDRIRPVVIQISSDPTIGDASETVCADETAGPDVGDAQLQVMAPLKTMMNSRGAHGLQARCALMEAATAINRAPEPDPGKVAGNAATGDAAASNAASRDASDGAGAAGDHGESAQGQFVHLRMCDSPSESGPPLGWVLSQHARAQIERFLDRGQCNKQALQRLAGPPAGGGTVAATALAD